MLGSIISNELRAAIFKNYQERKTRDVTSVKLGAKPGTIVFVTSAGSVTCQITEDEEFLYFSMPSGKENRRINKESFLKEIGFTQHQ